MKSYFFFRLFFYGMDFMEWKNSVRFSDCTNRLERLTQSVPCVWNYRLRHCRAVRNCELVVGFLFFLLLFLISTPTRPDCPPLFFSFFYVCTPGGTFRWAGSVTKLRSCQTVSLPFHSASCSFLCMTFLHTLFILTWLLLMLSHSESFF